MAIDGEQVAYYFLTACKIIAAIIIVRIILYFMGYSNTLPVLDTVVYWVLDALQSIYATISGIAQRIIG